MTIPIPNMITRMGTLTLTAPRIPMIIPTAATAMSIRL